MIGSRGTEGAGAEDADSDEKIFSAIRRRPVIEFVHSQPEQSLGSRLRDPGIQMLKTVAPDTIAHQVNRINLIHFD